MKLLGSAPVFQVRDVDATMRWYQTHLGFTPHPFPDTPPHVFCVLSRDAVEIMLQRVEDRALRPVGNEWHAYLRMEGVEELYHSVRGRPDVDIVEPPTRQPYGDTELVVRDPNGYVVVLSELIPKMR